MCAGLFPPLPLSHQPGKDPVYTLVIAMLGTEFTPPVRYFTIFAVSTTPSYSHSHPPLHSCGHVAAESDATGSGDRSGARGASSGQ